MKSKNRARISRRGFLKTAGLSSAALTVPSILSACAALSNEQEAESTPEIEAPSGPPEPETPFQHKSDFSVVLIGTGSPKYNPQRSGPSTLVHYNGNHFLVDMGNGTQARMIEARIAFQDMETVMFTHHHLDHNEEYIPVAISGWLQGRTHVNLIGPPKTKAMHEFLLELYKEDLEYRARRTNAPPDGMFTNVDITELEGDNTLEINGVKITSTEVPHSIYTLAYRFDADGKSIVVSGDLTFSENLIALAQDADLLVMDSGGVIRKGGQAPPPPAGGAGGARAHSSLEEVATMAAEANVRKMALTHFGPGEVDVEANQSEMGKIYSGEIIFGEDLMEVSP